MPGALGTAGAPLIVAGCFDDPTKNALNANNDWILYTNQSGVAGSFPNPNAPGSGITFPYTSFGTAITMINPNPAVGAAVGIFPAGTYAFSIYAVVTTTITTATSWLFTLGYTDDKQAQTPTASTSSTMTAGTVQQATYIFRTTGATALTFTPTSVSAAAGAIAFTAVLQRLA